MRDMMTTAARRQRRACGLGVPLLLFSLLALPGGAKGQAPEAAIEVRAHLVASRRPVIAAEVAGRVLAMPFRPGQAFPEGASLVSFDCAMHRAREARASAQRDRAARQLAALQSLDRQGATSRLEVGLAGADMAIAEAELRIVRLVIERCEITAPFAGTVVERRAQPGEYVSDGQPVIEVIDHAALELEAIVPSRLLAWLRPGSAFEIAFDEIDAALPARVARIAPVIDPVSQTVKIYAVVSPGTAPLVAGMSGGARIAPPGGNP